MTDNRKKIYRISFYNQGQIYELYARHVSQSAMYAFVEIEDIIFGEKSQVLVDPSEERLKSEFAGVNRTWVPLQSVIRIDEVEKEGTNKVIPVEDGAGSNVTRFPQNFTPPPAPPRK